MSHLFDWMGSDDGGMHVILNGTGKDNLAKKIEWYIVARNGDGPQIPIIPAVILAKKLFTDSLAFKGATACVAIVTLDEYLAELSQFYIRTYQI